MPRVVTQRCHNQGGSHSVDIPESATGSVTGRLSDFKELDHSVSADFLLTGVLTKCLK
jgi:hypothetical protein